MQGRRLHLVQPVLPRYEILFRFVNSVNLIFFRGTDDPCYLDSEDLRREYIMNETGKIFVGTHHRPKGRRWVYGQFQDVVLPATHLLLEMSGLSPTERGNPVQVLDSNTNESIWNIDALFSFLFFPFRRSSAPSRPS